MKTTLIHFVALYLLLGFNCSPSAHSDMVFVKGGNLQAGDGISLAKYEAKVKDYWISKYEITNKEVADVYTWAYERKKFLIDNSPREYVGVADMGMEYDFKAPQVRISEDAVWDLIDLARPGGHIKFVDGKLKTQEGYDNHPANNVTY
jgi:formylglycine-generating enzyme required for sulfatase activity